MDAEAEWGVNGGHGGKNAGGRVVGGEEAGGGEGEVGDDFAFDAETVLAGEEMVFGIGLEQIASRARGLAIGGGEENLFDKCFAAVAEAAEFGCEIVE